MDTQTHIRQWETPSFNTIRSLDNNINNIQGWSC